MDNYSALLITSAPSIKTYEKTHCGEYPQSLQHEIEQEAHKTIGFATKGHATKEEEWTAQGGYETQTG